MSVQLISSSEQLLSLKDDWNALTTSPLQSWDWLATWWKHYGNELGGAGAHDQESGGDSAAQLHVLAVYDRNKLVGIAPWYLDRSLVKGSVLRWIGSGEVCTDHLSLICRAERRSQVATAIAGALTTDCVDWDRIDLSGIDSKDETIATLLAELQERECVVSRQIADSCWVLDLPTTWDEYLASISKSHRKQLRQLERRVLESGRTEWHRVESDDQLDVAWPVLVDLHQRRRVSRGEPGCFASRTFHNFHREVAKRLLERNQLRISWLTIDGTPAAAEYHFADDVATYAYQGGVDPDRLQEEPGRLSTILCLRRAIEEGHRHFDFLRGDEPYKAHWRAEPRATFNYSVVPNRRLAKIRGRMLDLTGTMKDWVRSSVQQLAD